MSCNCEGSSETPPGSTSGVNAPVGASAFGGNTRVPRNPCGPPTCPTPPVSDAETRAPTCPSWAAALTAEIGGRLLLWIEGCIYTLKSKCSGMLRYDASTQRVSVVDPPYASSIPQENRYGFLAKAVPTLKKVCDDNSDDCVDEVRQELAAQILETASCGSLVIANPPLCGDVPPSQAADLDKQVRFDYLDAPLHEDAGCPAGVRFLVQSLGKRGSSQAPVDCKQWTMMRGLQLRGSDWGMLLKAAAGFKTALPAVFERTGGTDLDPCFTLRIAESAVGVPDGTANCQGLIWRKTGTEEAGWVAEDLGMRYYPLDAPQSLVLGVNTGLTDYDVNKAKACKIQAVISVQEFISLTGSGAGGSGTLTANGKLVAAGYCPVPGGFFLFNPEIAIPLTENKITISRGLAIGGTATPSGQVFKLLGYRIG